MVLPGVQPPLEVSHHFCFTFQVPEATFLSLSMRCFAIEHMHGLGCMDGEAVEVLPIEFPFGHLFPFWLLAKQIQAVSGMLEGHKMTSQNCSRSSLAF